jgi:hypothetical protein
MIYTFKVHYDDGESLESVEAEAACEHWQSLNGGTST